MVKKTGKQSQHVRRVRTRKGVKRVVVNKGYFRKVAKRRSRRGMADVPEQFRVNLDGANMYEFLKVSPVEDDSVIIKKIKMLAKYWHPDQPTGDGVVMGRLNDAKAVFKEDGGRYNYDVEFGVHSPSKQFVDVPIRKLEEDDDEDLTSSLFELDAENYISEMSESDFKKRLRDIFDDHLGDQGVIVRDLPVIFEESDLKLLEYDKDKKREG